jgi:hypothetical protein
MVTVTRGYYRVTKVPGTATSLINNLTPHISSAMVTVTRGYYRVTTVSGTATSMINNLTPHISSAMVTVTRSHRTVKIRPLNYKNNVRQQPRSLRFRFLKFYLLLMRDR